MAFWIYKYDNWRNAIKREKRVRCDVDIADFTAVGFIGLNMDSTVRIPEAYGTVLAATETIIAVTVEPRGQNRTLVTLQHVNLFLRKIFHAFHAFHAHLFFFFFGVKPFSTTSLRSFSLTLLWTSAQFTSPFRVRTRPGFKRKVPIKNQWLFSDEDAFFQHLHNIIFTP